MENQEDIISFLFRCGSRPCWGFWGSFVCLAESLWVSGSGKFGWKLFAEETESSQPLICNRQQEEGGSNSQNLLFWMICTLFTQTQNKAKPSKVVGSWLILFTFIQLWPFAKLFSPARCVVNRFCRVAPCHGLPITRGTTWYWPTNTCPPLIISTSHHNHIIIISSSYHHHIIVISS